MRTVASYHSFAEAERVAAHLRRHGVLATAIDHAGPYRGIAFSRFDAPYRVQLAYDADTDRAHDLLRHLPALEQMSAGWESDLQPDLARLDPVLAPPCPQCGQILPLDASLRACPNCSAPVDVAELIAARHGPETLDACYDAPDTDPANEDLLRRARLHCPECHYNLAGLPLEGSCPECNLPYDKRSIFN